MTDAAVAHRNILIHLREVTNSLTKLGDEIVKIAPEDPLLAAINAMERRFFDRTVDMEKRFVERMDQMETTLKAEMKNDITSLSLKTDVASTRTELGDFKTEVTAQMNTMKADIAVLQTQMTTVQTTIDHFQGSWESYRVASVNTPYARASNAEVGWTSDAQFTPLHDATTGTKIPSFPSTTAAADIPTDSEVNLIMIALGLPEPVGLIAEKRRQLLDAFSLTSRGLECV